MARKKLVEHNALVQAIEMGMSQNDIREKFGYKTSAALKMAYLNALTALGKVPAMNNQRKRKKKKIDNLVKINSRGSLVISKKLVDSLELDESHCYRVEKDADGLVLKIVAPPPKTILKKKASIES